MTEIEIKSSERGAYLKFRGLSAEHFEVEAGDPNFWARVRVSTYMSGSPALFFKEMAIDWRGWQDEKIWEDLDHCLRLVGTIDNLGHVSLRTEIWGSYYSAKMEITLLLDSGQLDAIAARVLEAVPFVP